jgi:ribose transport system ATP-binding protein
VNAQVPEPRGAGTAEPAAAASAEPVGAGTSTAVDDANMELPLMETRGISRSFNSRRVLGPVTLPVRSGSVHAVLGKNGAGKSTLMKILSGFDRPDTGDIWMNGEHVPGHGVRAHEQAGIAFVPQELTVFPGLTVADQVLLGDRYPRWAGAVVRRRHGEAAAAQTLQQLHLDIDPHRMVDTLTVAELRTVMIARALHLDAKILILDEPT